MNRRIRWRRQGPILCSHGGRTNWPQASTHFYIAGDAFRIGQCLSTEVRFTVPSGHRLRHHLEPPDVQRRGPSVGRRKWISAGSARPVERLDSGRRAIGRLSDHGPARFEKSLSCVNNLRLQAGRPIVRGHTIYVVDLQDGATGTGQKANRQDNPAYYLRFCKVTRAWAARCTTSSATTCSFVITVFSNSDKCESRRFQEITSSTPRCVLESLAISSRSLPRNRPSQQETSIETGLPVHNVVNVPQSTGAAGNHFEQPFVALGIGEIYRGFAGEDGEGLNFRATLRNQRGVRSITFGRRSTSNFHLCKPLVVNAGKTGRLN